MDKIEKIKKKYVDKEKGKALNLFNKFDWPDQKEDAWKYTRIDEKLINYNLKNIKKEKIKTSKKIKKIQNAEIFFSSPIKDKIEALNSAYYNNGLFIDIKKGKKEEVKAHYIAEKKGLYNTKNIIIVNESSEFDYLQTNKIQGKISRAESIDIFLKKNSKMNYYLLIETNKESQSISNINVFLSENSFFNIVTAQKGGMLNRIKITTNHNNGNSCSSIYCAFFGTNDDLIDITTNTTHDSENTNSNILVKGTLSDNSTSVYRGEIKITEKGSKTISFLSDHALLLGPKSISFSIPSLKIDTNDVKASHSASTGKIEKELLFYLMSRGINQKQAEKLISKGFLFDIFNKIKNEKTKNTFIEFFDKA